MIFFKSTMYWYFCVCHRQLTVTTRVSAQPPTRSSTTMPTSMTRCDSLGSDNGRQFATTQATRTLSPNPRGPRLTPGVPLRLPSMGVRSWWTTRRGRGHLCPASPPLCEIFWCEQNFLTLRKLQYFLVLINCRFFLLYVLFFLWILFFFPQKKYFSQISVIEMWLITTDSLYDNLYFRREYLCRLKTLNFRITLFMIVFF